jgi:hypothetical protein
MSVSKLRLLLNEVASDNQITLVEVQALIEAAIDEGQVTVGEAFLLDAALDAHQGQFTPDAYQALKSFLKGRH